MLVLCLGVLGYIFFGKAKSLPDKVISAGVKLVEKDGAYTVATAEEGKLEEALGSLGLKADNFWNAKNSKVKRIFENEHYYVTLTESGDHWLVVFDAKN